MTDQRTPQLLALAERNPVQALHLSGGRISERVHRGADGYAAIYIPDAGQYAVILNQDAPDANQQIALAAIVRHHTEAHNPQRVHVFWCNRPRTCEDCIQTTRRPAAPSDHYRRTMRRLNWG